MSEIFMPVRPSGAYRRTWGVRGIDADAEPVSVASPTPRPASAPVLMNSRRPILRERRGYLMGQPLRWSDRDYNTLLEGPCSQPRGATVASTDRISSEKNSQGAADGGGDRGESGHQLRKTL